MGDTIEWPALVLYAPAGSLGSTAAFWDSSARVGWPGWGRVRRRRSQKKTIPMMAARPRTPPTTPPTMAPVVDLDLGWLEGDAVAVGIALEAVLAEALAVLLK